MDYSDKSMSKSLVSAGAVNALNQMKYEMATELSINVPNSGDWGSVTSRDCGRIGGSMTRKLVELGKIHMNQG